MFGAGIMIFTEVYKWIFLKVHNEQLAWWILHGIILGLSLLAVVSMQVLPEEFLSEVVQVAGSSVLIYEMLWKRVAAPAINTYR